MHRHPGLDVGNGPYRSGHPPVSKGRRHRLRGSSTGPNVGGLTSVVNEGANRLGCEGRPRRDGHAPTLLARHPGGTHG
jgi:hypothetical protein